MVAIPTATIPTTIPITADDDITNGGNNGNGQWQGGNGGPATGGNGGMPKVATVATPKVAMLRPRVAKVATPKVAMLWQKAVERWYAKVERRCRRLCDQRDATATANGGNGAAGGNVDVRGGDAGTFNASNTLSGLTGAAGVTVAMQNTGIAALQQVGVTTMANVSIGH